MTQTRVKEKRVTEKQLKGSKKRRRTSNDEESKEGKTHTTKEERMQSSHSRVSSFTEEAFLSNKRKKERMKEQSTDETFSDTDFTSLSLVTLYFRQLFLKGYE